MTWDDNPSERKKGGGGGSSNTSGGSGNGKHVTFVAQRVILRINAGKSIPAKLQSGIRSLKEKKRRDLRSR